MKRRPFFPRCRVQIAPALLLTAALIASACGTVGVEPAATGPSDEATGQEAAATDTSVIRFALPSEPLWQWLVDSGTLAAWESEHGYRIEANHPFRPFAAFVSDHADIIVVNALDIPVFAHGSDSQPVIIGKYAPDRSLTATKRTSQATDLAGVVEGRIAMETQLGSTLLWALIADAYHNLDLSYGSPDFKFVIATSGLADTVERGGADACICQPNESVELLGTGVLRPLYGGKSASRVYAEVLGDDSRPPPGQVFLAHRDWRARNPEIVEAFLALWEQALQHWHSNAPELIAQYPELLSVQTDAEIAWLAGYVAQSEWIAPTVYADSADADSYQDAVARLKRAGHIPQDAAVPEVALYSPATTTGER